MMGGKTTLIGVGIVLFHILIPTPSIVFPFYVDLSFIKKGIILCSYTYQRDIDAIGVY